MQRTIRNLSLSLAVAGLCCLSAAAQANNGMNNSSTTRLTPSERTFVHKAAEGGKAEVELGKLATEKASSQQVKDFGQRMVDDHTKANDQLKQVASEEGISLPDRLNAKDEATKARLEKLSGKAFDRAYMRDMVTDHTQDVSEFRTESKMAKDPGIKNFASQTLPTLEDHLKEAKKIEPQVAGGTRHQAASTTPTGSQ